MRVPNIVPFGIFLEILLCCTHMFHLLYASHLGPKTCFNVVVLYTSVCEISYSAIGTSTDCQPGDPGFSPWPCRVLGDLFSPLPWAATSYSLIRTPKRAWFCHHIVSWYQYKRKCCFKIFMIKFICHWLHFTINAQVCVILFLIDLIHWTSFSSAKIFLKLSKNLPKVIFEVLSFVHKFLPFLIVKVWRSFSCGRDSFILSLFDN